MIYWTSDITFSEIQINLQFPLLLRYVCSVGRGMRWWFYSVLHIYQDAAPRNASFYSPLNTHSMIAVLHYRLRLAIKVHAFVRVPTASPFIVFEARISFVSVNSPSGCNSYQGSSGIFKHNSSRGISLHEITKTSICLNTLLKCCCQFSIKPK